MKKNFIAIAILTLVLVMIVVGWLIFKPKSKVNSNTSNTIDIPCDGIDSNNDGIGNLSSILWGGKISIKGEPACDCLLGDIRYTGRAIGICKETAEICVLTMNNGSQFVIKRKGVNPTSEVCNGLDDDCDGLIDASAELGGICKCDPEKDSPRPCGITKGECQAGIQRCLPSHEWSDICEGEIPPAPVDHEQCDNKDNDCDGLIDENYNVGSVCGTGSCTGGKLECDFFGISSKCSTEIYGSKDKTSQEVCDEIDNDCDGLIDNTYYCLKSTDRPSDFPPPPPTEFPSMPPRF